MKLKAEIDGSLVAVQIINDRGETLRKHLTLNQYVELLNNSVENVESNNHIGSVPNGYYDAWISNIYDKTFSCIVTVSQSVYPAQYFEKMYRMPFPALVFYFDVKSGVVNKSKCFAMKDTVVTDTTKLYYFPYSNVYDDGNICWGTNQLPELSCLKDIDLLVQLFMGATYNNDLWTIKRVGNHYSSVFEMFEKLNNQKIFPADVLQEVYLTVGELK